MTLLIGPNDKLLNRFFCPCCHHLNVLGNLPKEDVSIPVENDDRGYPIKQIAYNTQSKCVCGVCGNNITLSFGESRYSVYESPLSYSSIGDIFLLARFDNECNGYSVYKATKPENKDEYIYFILEDRFKLPIFLTEKKALELLDDHYETLRYICGINMSRCH